MSLRTVAPAVQEPRVRVAPPAHGSDADDAAFLSSSYGLTPDDWQLLVLDDWLGVRRDGRYSSLTCGLSVPRQNGKNGIIEVRELYGMVVAGEKFLHTAHEVKTARKAFLRLCSFFENSRNYPELAELVLDIRRTNGQEAVLLKNGGSVEFVARSKGSGRGFTVDVLVMDEAQELSDDALEALMPTTSAAPLGNPQWILTGTPPGPNANGEVFTRTRVEALEGKSKRLSWHEWSCEGDVDLDDRANWHRANPALGGRLQLDVVEGERARFSDDGFARERLGMWASSLSGAVIGADTWRLRADEESRAVDRLALAIDVAPDRSTASVSLAGQRADGEWHVELDEQRNGVGWLAAHLERRCKANPIRAVVIDGISPEAHLVDDLKARGIKVTTTMTRDMTSACAAFYDGAMEGWLHHIDQPQLNLALSVARKRGVGDAWAWNRKNATSDITPLVACTLALWGAQSSSVKKPTRSRSSQRIVVMS